MAEIYGDNPEWAENKRGPVGTHPNAAAPTALRNPGILEEVGGSSGSYGLSPSETQHLREAGGGVSLLEAFGDITRGSGLPDKGEPLGDGNKFKNWFQSEQGQVLIGGFFNSLGSISAGLAGLPPGGRDTSSLARGAAMATQGYAIAKKEYDANKFIQFIDKRIAEEEGAKNPDQDKIDTLQMMRRDPEGYIKGAMSGENWFERMQAAYGMDKQKKEDLYQKAKGMADDYFDNAIDAKLLAKLNAGDQEALKSLYQLPPTDEMVPYWVGPGGKLAHIKFQTTEGEKGGWDILEWIGLGGEGETPKTSGSSTVPAPKPGATSVATPAGTVDKDKITIGDWWTSKSGRIEGAAEQSRQNRIKDFAEKFEQGKAGPLDSW